jgi:AAA domain
MTRTSITTESIRLKNFGENKMIQNNGASIAQNDSQFKNVPPFNEQSTKKKDVEQEEKPDTLPDFISWGEFNRKVIEEPKQLIKGLICKGGKMVIGGASKAGKTWLLLDLAIAIATGLSWLGFDTTKGRVLYVNLEITDYFFQQRGRMVSRIREVNAEDLNSNLMIWNLRGSPVSAEELKAALLRRIGDQKFDAIMIDPLYKLINGQDMNNSGVMQQLLGAIEQIAKRSDSVLIYADHFVKGNVSQRSSIDRMSGSGVNARDPDAIVTFSELEGAEDAADGRMRVEFTVRNYKPIKAFNVARIEDPPLFERRDDITETKLEGTPGAKKTYHRNDLLKYLPDEGSLHPDVWLEAANSALGVSKSSFQKMRPKLKNDGYVTEVKDGWALTPNGLEKKREVLSYATLPKVKINLHSQNGSVVSIG